MLAGALLGELTDPNLSTICPVNKPHPRLEVIGAGAGSGWALKPACLQLSVLLLGWLVRLTCQLLSTRRLLRAAVSGSSRSLYAWRPAPAEEQEDAEGEGEGHQRRGSGGGGGGDGGGGGGGGRPPFNLRVRCLRSCPPAELCLEF